MQARRKPSGPALPSKRAGASNGGEGDTPALNRGLYVVATPLGHARDITLRALDVINAADWLYAENSAETAKLLALHDIRRKIASFREENAKAVIPEIVAAITAGESVALVSDAGTPLISDPGENLVAAIVAAGLPVIPVPGASAGIAALSASGLPALPALMMGFLPERQSARRTALEGVKALSATLVIYEAPHRLCETLADAKAVLGDRMACVAREMTKHFEEFRRASLTGLLEHFTQTLPRGEIVLLIAPPGEAEDVSFEAIDAALARALETMRVKDAADAVAAALSAPRRLVYQRALALKDGPRKSAPDGQ